MGALSDQGYATGRYRLAAEQQQCTLRPCSGGERMPPGAGGPTLHPVTERPHVLATSAGSSSAHFTTPSRARTIARSSSRRPASYSTAQGRMVQRRPSRRANSAELGIMITFGVRSRRIRQEAVASSVSEPKKESSRRVSPTEAIARAARSAGSDSFPAFLLGVLDLSDQLRLGLLGVLVVDLAGSRIFVPASPVLQTQLADI